MRLFALGLLAVVFSWSSANAQPIPPGWKQLYDRMAKMIVKKDVKGYMTLLDKSFVNIKNGRRTSYEPYEKSFADFLSKFTNIKVSLAGSNFRKKGDVALVDYRYVFSGTYTAAPKGRILRFSEVGSDTWGLVHGKYFQFIEAVRKQKVLSG